MFFFPFLFRSYKVVCLFSFESCIILFIDTHVSFGIFCKYQVILQVWCFCFLFGFSLSLSLSVYLSISLSLSLSPYLFDFSLSFCRFFFYPTPLYFLSSFPFSIYRMKASHFSLSLSLFSLSLLYSLSLSSLHLES